MATLLLLGHYVAAKTGKTGLTVTLDLHRLALADGTSSEVVTAGACTEVGDGLYRYRYATADLATYQFAGVFKTSDATVDQQHIPVLGIVIPDELTSSRAAPGAAMTLADNAIATAKFADGAITAAKFAANAITSTVLADASITSAKLAANAIASTTIADGAITAAKLAANAIGATQIASNAIAAAKIATGAITAAKFAADALDSAALAASAVTKIAAAILTTPANKLVTDAAGAVNLTAAKQTEITAIKARTDLIPDATAAAGDVPTAAAISDAVWEETVGDHMTEGSTGYALKQASTNTPGAAAQAIWQSELIYFQGASWAGKMLYDAAAGVANPAAIADAVLDEALTGHATPGSAGAALADAATASGAPTAAAIADAVWDEETSDHNTAGSTGQALTAGSSEGGAGATSTTITVDNGSENQPLDGVEVWISTDAGGSNVVASGETDAAGKVTMMLDPGAYFVWCQRAGTNFSNPTELTVS